MTEENKQTTETTKPDLTVDIGGTVVTCANAEEKAKVIAARDSDKLAAKTLREKQEATEAKARKAEEKAANEERRALALEAAKKDDAEKAEEIFAKPVRAEMEIYKNKLVKAEIANLVRSRGDVVEKAIPDIVNQLYASNTFKLKGDDVENEDGKGLKSIVDKYIDERDHFRIAKTATGSGASKAAAIPVSKNQLSGWQAIASDLQKGLKNK